MLEGLEFQNQGIFDDKIYTVSAVQTDAFISYWQRHLPLEFQIPEMEFMTQTLFVGRLHQPGTKFTMHLDGSANYLFGKPFVEKFTPCLRVSVVNHVCKTPTLNSATSGFSAAASSACIIASRVSTGSIILSIQSLAAPYRGSVCSS